MISILTAILVLSLLVLVHELGHFAAARRLGVGVVKYYASTVRKHIAAQLQIAQSRDPAGGLDLSVLNMADPSGLFKRKM